MKKEKVHPETAEFVLPGHPDRICDAAVDTLVEFVRNGFVEGVEIPKVAGDPEGQCGVEAAVVFDHIYLTGRIAAREDLLAAMDVEALVRHAWKSAGYGEDRAGYVWGPVAEKITVHTNFCFGPFEEGERELRHLSDDQSISVGYANALEETGRLPPAHWLAREIGKQLHRLRAERGAGQVGPDGKVVVRVETDGEKWAPKHVSISLNHHIGSDWLLLRQIAEEAVGEACRGRPLPKIDLNGAGMFISGGPNGDNGLSGKKLVVDAYGPTVPIGGGAWCGKDFRKVDRIGGMLARRLALLAVKKNLCREARVVLEYIPGSDRPLHIALLADGKWLPGNTLSKLGDPEIRNLPLWQEFVKVKTPLPELARWGHFLPNTPWEK